MFPVEKEKTLEPDIEYVFTYIYIKYPDARHTKILTRWE